MECNVPPLPGLEILIKGPDDSLASGPLGRKEFWRQGYYVNTVGRIREAIERDLCNQLQEDFNKDQMGMKEYIDLFTCEPGAGCQKSPLGVSW